MLQCVAVRCSVCCSVLQRVSRVRGQSASIWEILLNAREALVVAAIIAVVAEVRQSVSRYLFYIGLSYRALFICAFLVRESVSRSLFTYRETYKLFGERLPKTKTYKKDPHC